MQEFLCVQVFGLLEQLLPQLMGGRLTWEARYHTEGLRSLLAVCTSNKTPQSASWMLLVRGTRLEEQGRVWTNLVKFMSNYHKCLGGRAQ